MLGQAALNAPNTDIKGYLGKFRYIFFFLHFFPNKINVTEIKAHCAAAQGSQGKGWVCMLIYHTADKLRLILLVLVRLVLRRLLKSGRVKSAFFFLFFTLCVVGLYMTRDAGLR